MLEVGRQTPLGEHPFHHLYFEKVLPHDLYDGLRRLMLAKKNSPTLTHRQQDSPLYTTPRFPLHDSTNIHVLYLRAIFSDPEVLGTFASRFYSNSDGEFARSLSIHEKEFEFTFCEPDRFQNIHVDIPPKYLSFVLYFPEGDLNPEQEDRNGTVLYDSELKPVYSARYRANAGVCFAPHFSSYHGFSTTIPRDALVMFLVNRAEQEAWEQTLPSSEPPPFTHWGNCIENKLLATPLREFGASPDVIAHARAASRVNAPEGRVLIEKKSDQGKRTSTQ
ncbi:MAG: hypothetical protein WCJ88_02015 [Actinomycetes bacterium]